MELQTGEFPGWDRSPVAFMRTAEPVQCPNLLQSLLQAILENRNEDVNLSNRELNAL